MKHLYFFFTQGPPPPTPRQPRVGARPPPAGLLRGRGPIPLIPAQPDQADGRRRRSRRAGEGLTRGNSVFEGLVVMLLSRRFNPSCRTNKKIILESIQRFSSTKCPHFLGIFVRIYMYQCMGLFE